MKKSKQKQKSHPNWAANLASMTVPAPVRLRLPALITVAKPIVLDRRCGRCKQQGHNVRTCTNRRARSAHPTLAKAKGITHTVLVARRAIALRVLQGGDRVLHAAYDKESKTLQVAFRGTFMTHWYAYANVPPSVYEKLAKAKNPDEIVEAEIESKYTKTYVHRRKMLPASRNK